jgi:hypothetical protein
MSSRIPLPHFASFSAKQMRCYDSQRYDQRDNAMTSAMAIIVPNSSK